MRSRRAEVAGLVLLLLGCLSRSAEAEDRLRRSLTDRSWSCPTPRDSLRFDLPGRWILPNSIVAMAGSETLRIGVDYDIEPAEGILTLHRAVGDSILRVDYRVVPLGIPRIYQSIVPPDTSTERMTRIPPREGAIDRWRSEARLDLRGSKTIGLEIGSGQDLTVRQSLDVSLSGEIVPGVTVRGVLSDRETPLQPEGRTTELTDLDKVFLRVEGRGAEMTLGDLQLRGPPGRFTRYQRQLEGVAIRARRGGGEIRVTAASLPGEFVTIEFLGEEGKQGPYELRGDEVSLDAIVIAGSETVWLDGEKLIRGEDKDYTIDYAAATLTFSGRRIVGKDSRVAVDLQISSQPYRRNATAAEIGWGSTTTRDPQQGGSVRLSLLSERDDRSHPVGGALTDREKELLAAAGDSLIDELASGVDCQTVGYGPEHTYQPVESDSLDQPFFRYVGPDSGSCRVRFDDVGDKKGDYLDSLLTGGETIYRYVGYRQGRYLPGRAVPRPVRRDLLDLAARWDGPGGMHVAVEAAGSYDDPNTLSSRDDGDRLGGALDVRLERETGPVRIGGRDVGRWGALIETRDLDDRFRPLGRIDPSWYGYDWGLAPDRLSGGDRRRAAELRHQPGAGFSLSGRYETLSNRRDLEGTRNLLTLRREGRIFGGVEHLRARTEDRITGATVEGDRAVEAVHLGLGIDRVQARTSYRWERDEAGKGRARTGRGYDEWSARAAYRIPVVEARVELMRTERDDRTADSTGWRRSDRAKTWEGRVDWSPPGRLLEARYIRRDLDAVSGGTTRSDLASLLWSQDQGSGVFGQRINATLNTTVLEGRIKSIEYVGEGKGRYDSLGVYVGRGDYDLVLVASGTSDLQRRLEGSWRIDLSPGRNRSGAVSPWGRLWKSSQWLLYATFSSRTSGSAADFWNRLVDLLAARSEDVALASHNIRGEVSSLPRARWASPRLRAQRERRQEQLFENVRSRRERDLLALILRSLPTSSWTLEQETEIEREEEFTTLLDRSSSRGSLGWESSRLRVESWWRRGAGWTVRLAAVGRRRDRIPTGERYEIVQLVPGLQWIPREKTRLDVAATRTWIERPTETILGLEKAGWDGRASLTVQLRRSLDLSLHGTLHSPQGGQTQTTLRAEMRALF